MARQRCEMEGTNEHDYSAKENPWDGEGGLRGWCDRKGVLMQQCTRRMDS